MGRQKGERYMDRRRLNFIAISKEDVIREDFSYIMSLINSIAGNLEMVFEMRNTWEVNFYGYDDDLRELPEIPEVVNWVEKSVDAGIPWFYFLRCEPESIGVHVFLAICCMEPDPFERRRYVFDLEKLEQFLYRNFHNLNAFLERFEIPEEVGIAATDKVMALINALLSTPSSHADDESLTDFADMFEDDDLDLSLDEDGFLLDDEDDDFLWESNDHAEDGSLSAPHGESANAGIVTPEQMKEEGLLRLELLERYFGLNPNVRKYYAEDRLYYSYLTMGGFMGSIDTIHYDPHYAELVRVFEEERGYKVYHVIEHKNTLAFLYISDEAEEWEHERPNMDGVFSMVIERDTNVVRYGCITLDSLQGALRRRDDEVYTSLEEKERSGKPLQPVDQEVLERFAIMKEQGLLTDLDIDSLYCTNGEICFSQLQNVFGVPVGVVDRISSRQGLEELLTTIFERQTDTPYFMLIRQNSMECKLAFLCISGDPAEWNTEKGALGRRRPKAVIVDMNTYEVYKDRITIDYVNGGPVYRE